MGTTGDDDFHVKVSADGTAWNEAIVVDRATGAVSFPNSSFPGGANLTTAYAATTVAINSDSGTDATVNAFTTANAGVAPASGGGTANFLRPDGSWAAPSGGGGVSDGDKGDITVSGSGTVWDIDANTVTNAKAADVPTATFKGRTTAATGDPEDLTVAQAKTLLNLTGTNSGDQTITLTSDVTGSGTGSVRRRHRQQRGDERQGRRHGRQHAQRQQHRRCSRPCGLVCGTGQDAAGLHDR